MRPLDAVPGEPISAVSPFAAKAPLAPEVLKAEKNGPGSVVLPRRALFSKVANGAEAGAAPKVTPVMTLPAESKRLTASPPVLRPTPEPE